ncbi:MAG: ribose-5-phosphate isomerase RpiA [Candidatus Anstonellales archaeon]
MTDYESEKKNAALRALSYVKSGMIVGLGTGTTAKYFIEALGEKIRLGKLRNIYGICTSFETQEIALDNRIPLGSLDKVNKIDLAVDGADAVDSNLNSIKGGGGALAREKIIAYNSKKFILIIDESKLRKTLTNVRVPIEVMQFAYTFLLNRFRALGFRAEARKGTGKAGPVVTDNGNLLIDLHMNIVNPKKTELQLKNIPGVVEVGVFTRCDLLIVGKKDGYVEIFPKHKQPYINKPHKQALK